MSWRLWNARSQNAYCARSTPRPRLTPTTPRPRQSTLTVEPPKLSSSVSSASSDEAEPRQSLPFAQRTKSVGFDSLVHSIQAKQELTRPISPLPIPEPSNPPSRTTSTRTTRPSSPRPVEKSSTSTVATATSFNSSTAASSETSSASDATDHSVVRGFAPGHLSSYTSKSQLAPSQPTPILKSASSRTAPAVVRKKGTGMFMLGGSSGEDESSLKEHMSIRSRNPAFSPDSQRGSATSSKKQTSFNERVEVCPKPVVVDHAVFDDSDEEEDEVSESAIDDDDDAWEDDDASEEPDEPKTLTFNRVDSSKNLLPSRKSQIALALEQQKRSSVDLPRSPALRRSRTSTPNGPSMPASPLQDSTLEQFAGKPIQTTTNHQAATPMLSPRTTRRNMLAGELSESFRKQMIHERSQRQIFISQGPPKRAHTSVDLGSQRSPRPDGEPSRVFDSGDYHTQGW